MADDTPDFAGSGSIQGVEEPLEHAIPIKPKDEQQINQQVFESAPPQSQAPVPEASRRQHDVDSQRVLVEEKIKANERAHQSELEALQQRDSAIRRVQETMQLPVDSQPPPALDMKTADRSTLQATTQIGVTWPAMIGVGLALAGMIGKHGHGIGSQFFLGAFLDSYAKGRQSAMKQQRDEWWKQVEYEYKVNQRRLEYYRLALGVSEYNQKLNHQQRSDLLKTYADLYGDAKMSALAARQDLEGAQKQLNNYEKAQDRYLKEAHKTGTALDFITKNNVNKQWSQAAGAKFLEAHGRLPGTGADEIQALKEYPYTQWSQDKKGSGETIDPKTGKPVQNTSQGGGPKSDSIFGVGETGQPTDEQRRRFNQLQDQHGPGQQRQTAPVQKQQPQDESDEEDNTSLSPNVFGSQSLFG